MPETKDYLNQHQENGNINIAEDVVASIAAVAAAEVEGVAALTSGSVDIAEFLGKKSMSKGVKILITEAATTVDVFLSVKYGCVIPSIAAAVQEAVSNALESMAGLAVTAVNVHVTGITFEKEEKPAVETTEG